MTTGPSSRGDSWVGIARIASPSDGRAAHSNFLARRANAGKYVQEELEALVAERDGATLVSASGLLKVLFR